MGNPFEEESQDVVKLDTKEIAGPAAVETVMNAKRIGQEQFEAFTRECLLDRTKAVDDPIPRNKLKVFSTSTPRSQSKGQQQLASIKNDRELFARLYIGCQTRDGNLEEFFRHENQACPPALSDGGSLCTGTKYDLLTCLEEVSDAKTETPVTTCIVLDGAAIVQMLKPSASKTFEEYAQQIFIPYMSTKLQTVSRLDLVWDTYLADSLKGSTRAKRDKACGDVWWLPQPYQETGRTSYEWTATRPSCSGSSQQLSWNGLTRRTSNSSLLMERQCSASHYCQI
ncbi:hypothetical protein AAFF_G00046360 [Aldrovandia affinis]|uniref:Uncharacterized protein n=1 Tax=Aldrovandia affinis TaxID=143900 RepID=A0AAD7WF84_9TELE|nr:hypothetical protein AAFF_G00046360 [Aldrovandia affinis]